MFELEISYQPVQKGGEKKDKFPKIITKKTSSQNEENETYDMEGKVFNGDTNVSENNENSASESNRHAAMINNQIIFPGGKIGLLKKTLESIGEIVEHVDIKARAEGLDIQAMDSMHVVFVDIFLSKNLFDKYRCDRDVTLGIKVKSLLAIIKDLSFPTDSSLHLSSTDEPEALSIYNK